MDSSNSNLAIDINNLVLLCPKCNLSQGAKIDTRFSDLEPEDRVSIDG
jgi:5-methylcytosine-specific restriction endonuclease McrA